MSGPDDTQVVADCCAEEANLEEQPDGRSDVTIRVCRVCGRRHFEVTVDPAVIGVEVTG